MMFSLALTISTSIFIKLLKLTLKMCFSREKNDVYVFLFLCVFIALKLVQVSHKLWNPLQLSHLANAKSKYEKKRRRRKKKKLALKNKIVSDGGKRWSKSTMTSTAPGYPAQSPLPFVFWTSLHIFLCHSGHYDFQSGTLSHDKQLSDEFLHFPLLIPEKKKKKIHSVDLLGEDPIEFPIQISLYFCLRVILGHLWVIFWVMYQNFTSWNN